MQIHPPSAHVWDGEFPVHLHPSGEFAVIDVDPDAGGTRLFMESVSDCDRLIAAAVWARSLLLTRTSERARGGRWCSARISTSVPFGPGEWQCTLAAGHEGRHEARGAFPLPVWSDGDTAIGYDETAGTDAS